MTELNYSAKMNTLKRLFRREEILTIPNMMSFFRILLIPVILYLYIWLNRRDLAVVVVCVSALTDIADGIVARKFNMTSDFGKLIDPFADKITQFSILICLIKRYRYILTLIIFFCAKEILLVLMSFFVFKYTNTVNSSRWYGKLCTVILETTISILLFFDNIPSNIVNILIGTSILTIIFSQILYLDFFHNRMKQTLSNRIFKRRFSYAIMVCSVVLWCVIIALVICIVDKINFPDVLCYSPDQNIEEEIQNPYTGFNDNGYSTNKVQSVPILTQ